MGGRPPILAPPASPTCRARVKRALGATRSPGSCPDSIGRGHHHGQGGAGDRASPSHWGCAGVLPEFAPCTLSLSRSQRFPAGMEGANLACDVGWSWWPISGVGSFLGPWVAHRTPLGGGVHGGPPVSVFLSAEITSRLPGLQVSEFETGRTGPRHHGIAAQSWPPSSPDQPSRSRTSLPSFRSTGS